MEVIATGSLMPSLVAEIGDAIECHLRLIGMLQDDGLDDHLDGGLILNCTARSARAVNAVRFGVTSEFSLRTTSSYLSSPIGSIIPTMCHFAGHPHNTCIAGEASNTSNLHNPHNAQESVCCEVIVRVQSKMGRPAGQAGGTV